MSATERDVWRDWFAELALILDQSAAYLWTGDTEYAKDRLSDARQRVDAATARLSDAAGVIPVFHPAPPAPTDLESQLIPAIGPLIGALESRDDRTKRAAMELLARWLPRLQPEQLQHVSQYQRRVLYRWLQIEMAPQFPEFICLICVTLTRLQDLGALPAMRKLASSAAVTRGGKRVKAEAEACRVQLELVDGRAKLNGTLLRAANSPITDLLRPADSRETGDDSLLLRPTD